MKSLYAAIVSAIVFLCGCTQIGISGGGNDFPNSHTTTAALGKMIVDNLANGDHWSDSVSVPQALSPLASAQAIHVPQASMPGLSKLSKSVSGINIRLDYSDTSNGIVGLLTQIGNDSIEKSDTVLIVYDDAFRDSIKNNEHLKSAKGSILFKRSNIYSSYSYTDADGDGILNNRNGKPNRVLVVTSETFALGAMTKSEIEIDGGKDGNLDTKEDMLILTYNTLALDRKGDTLTWTKYESGDGDSVIIDASSYDSCFVRLLGVEKNILGQSTSIEAVFVIYPLFTEKNHPVYYRNEKTFANLITIKNIVRSQNSDSLIIPGDTVVVNRIAESPIDSEAIDTLGLRIIVHGTISDSSRNDLIGLYHHRIKRLGVERDIVFSLTSSEPIKAGDKPQTGSFTMRISYSDNQWIALDGSFTPAKMTAVFTDSKGNTINLVWNRNGDPVQ